MRVPDDLVTILAASLLAGLAAPARAADFTVNTTADQVDALPGDGLCASTAGGCTLRAAVQEANALPGDDRILLPVGIFELAIPGAFEDAAATGDLDVTENLAIVGAGAFSTIIDAGGLDRLLEVPAGFFGIALEIGALSLVGGDAGLGGAISLFANSSLTVREAVLSRNRAGRGGAIAAAFSGVTLVGSVVAGNRADDDGGGLALDWSGTRLERAIVASNDAGGDGGGLSIGAGSAIIVDSAIEANRAAGDGGGLYSEGGGILDPTVDLEVTSSTFQGNRAAGSGGGLHVGFGTALTMTSSTLSTNFASEGGGLHVVPRLDSTIRFSTLARNVAWQGAAISGSPGDGFPGSLTVTGTILARGAVGRNCLVFERLFSGGTNLDSDGSCRFTGPGDLSAVSPLLRPLGRHGGATATYVPLPFSPAVDAAGTACPAADQRGKARAVDGDGDGSGACDIGAAEYQWVEPDTCDLNADGATNDRDYTLWVGGCRAGSGRWRCDVDGNGSFELADLLRHGASCLGLLPPEGRLDPSAPTGRPAAGERGRAGRAASLEPAS